jgi:hypothetical protein
MKPWQIKGGSTSAPAAAAEEETLSEHDNAMSEEFYDGPLDVAYDGYYDAELDEATMREAIAQAEAEGRAYAAGEEYSPEVYTHQGIGGAGGWPSPDHFDL